VQVATAPTAIAFKKLLLEVLSLTSPILPPPIFLVCKNRAKD